MIKKLQQIWRGHQAIQKWLNYGGSMADWNTTQHRKATCLDCPHNQSCGFWGWFTRWIADQVKRPFPVNNPRLKTCDICGCALRLKVQMELSNIVMTTPDGELEKFPANCWLTKELQ